jgi:uncharacterized damage-inducible protein DinB
MKAAAGLLLLCLAPVPIRAQSPLPPNLLDDWQRDRAMVLAYIEAMPDSALGFRPTPGVRTFAEQFEHIVATNLEVAAVALRNQARPPAIGEPTQYLSSKSALRAFAASSYAYLLAALQDASAEDLARPVAMYGQPPQPALRLVGLSLEHSVWTLGQVVPYLRLNGVTPPFYAMPF